MKQLTKEDVEIIAKKPVYEGFFKMMLYHVSHRIFAGGWTPTLDREIFSRKPVAGVIPFDPILDKVVFVEQFRLGALEDNVSPWLLEIVAGVIEPGETPENMAYRETKEEAGLDVLELMPVMDYWTSPGGTDEYLSLFCAKVDASNAGGLHGMPHEHEDIRVSVMDSQAAFDAVESGRINNAATIIGLQWLQIHHDALRAKWG